MYIFLAWFFLLTAWRQRVPLRDMYKILTCVGLYENFTQRPCLFWRHE